MIRSATLNHRFALLERALFTLAAILLGWYVIEHALTFYEQEAASREMESVHVAVATPTTPVTHLATGSVVGRIEIPRAGVSAMVREGDDTATLRHAVGHIPDTPLPGERGNAGLAGHRDSFFRGLKNVHVGDEVTVTTAAGVLKYIVQRTTIVDPDDVSVLNSTSQPTLTLVTCYPFYYLGAAPRRFIVQAELAR